jgi:hypothetical protein
MTRFVCGFIITTVLMWTGYLALFLFQLGAPTAAEYWLAEAQLVKARLLSRHADQPKLLIVGGSSVWMGIDSRLVEQTVLRPTVNAGLHAMRPLHQLLDEIRAVLHRGDIVIVALEYDFYTLDTPYNDWYVNQVMAIEPEAFWRLPWSEKAQFFLSVSPTRVLDGALTRVFLNHSDRIRSRSQRRDPHRMLETIRQVGLTPEPPSSNYTFQNIDSHGDAVVSLGSFTTYPYPLMQDRVAQRYPWDTLRAFLRDCAARSVTVYLTWPPIVRGVIDFRAPLVDANVRSIMQHIHDLPVTVLGQPMEFQYDRTLFTDSGYHLSHEGRAQHTASLLRRLCAQPGVGCRMSKGSQSVVAGIDRMP